MSLILVFRKKNLKWGKRILVFAVILLYLSNSYFFVSFLSKPLKSPFPRPNLENIPPSVGAIVVLTGGRFYTKLRTLYGVELYYRFKDIPLLFSGGLVDKTQDVIAEAEIAARIAENLGVPRERIIVEEESRNTYENALYTLKILKERNIKNFLLVTSGFHMYRAMAVFRKNGITPIPVPSAYIYNRYNKKIILDTDTFIPSVWAFHSLFFVLHEYLGIAWYKVMGYI